MGMYLFFVAPHLRFFGKVLSEVFELECKADLALRCTEKKSAPSNVYLTGKD